MESFHQSHSHNESWNLLEQAYASMKELKESVFEKAIQTMGDEGIDWFGDRTTDFAERLKQLPEEELRKSVAYHVLIGSSISPAMNTGLRAEDLIEDYSVGAFYKRLLKELEEKV